MDKEVKDWLIDVLDSWNQTFDPWHDEDGEPIDDEPTSLDDILPKLRDDKPLTQDDYEEILFHLWQSLHPKLEEYYERR